MAEFAERLTGLLLVRLLEERASSATPQEGLPPSEVKKLIALVANTADAIGPQLARISSTFHQYTNHDFDHSCNLIRLMGQILPEEARKNLNALELTLLLLAAMLHDAGMVVSDAERAEAIASEGFKKFQSTRHADRLRAAEQADADRQPERARLIRDAMLADWFRRLHAGRVHQRVTSLASQGVTFAFNQTDFARELGQLCESHNWGAESSWDRNPDHTVARLPTELAIASVKVNLRFLACCLRLADILDFDRSRTPTSVLELIDLTEATSWQEWNKHLSVQGWTIEPTRISFRAPCHHPALYVAVLDFLGEIDRELAACARVLDDQPRKTQSYYQLTLPLQVNRRDVAMADESYVAGGFRFQLEYEEILRLLMDKSLYPDPTLFLRELLQNALDACRRKEARAKAAGVPEAYTPKIVVWDYSDDETNPRVIFQDNGIGMSLDIVERYFLRVGKSFYRSAEFDAERAELEAKGIELDACSQFGIGILSCFLVADRFEVETYQHGHDPLHITIEGPTRYFVIRKLPRPTELEFPTAPTSELEDGPPRRTGTRVMLPLNPEGVRALQRDSAVSRSSREGEQTEEESYPDGRKPGVFGVLDYFAANIDYSIAVICSTVGKTQTIAAMRWQSIPENATQTTDLEISDLPTGSMGYPRLQEASSLRQVLSPVAFGIAQRESGARLRGAMWFWLLGDSRNQPTPQRGAISVSTEIALPRIANAFGQFQLAALLKGTEGCDGQRYKEILLELVGSGRNLKSWRTEFNLSEIWRDLSVDERRLLAHVAKSLLKGPRSWWFDDTDAVSHLQEGDFEKAGQVSVLAGVLAPLWQPRHAGIEFALHGIRVPGGIVEFDPMAGESRRLESRFFVGCLRLDFRGAAWPQPAANRLFLPAGEWSQVWDDLREAIACEAIELASRYPPASTWVDWIEKVLKDWEAWEENRHGERARRIYTRVLQTLGLAARLDGNVARHSREVLEHRFGEAAPVVPHRSRRDGVIATDTLNIKIAEHLIGMDPSEVFEKIPGPHLRFRDLS